MDNINRKLQAIKDKDLDNIVAKNTYIPGLGWKYTKDDLAAWLKVRSDYLEEALKSSKSNLDTGKDSIYASIVDKANAGKILAGQDFQVDDTAPDYENLVKLMLYKFVEESNG